MTTTYFIAETLPDSIILQSRWQATKASTLIAAKRMAQAGRSFQGTQAHVGVDCGGRIVRVATRNPANALQPGWFAA